MDSNALLDYALFQLTPTRTRCDLMVFSGKKNEKLASGLVEPFISHLKYAKDQIPKGGYSITLSPPIDAPWFTKSTFQRFVRFVSTPEILERMVRIEREISQIESSIQSNEISNTDMAVHTGEGNLSTADGITKKSRDSSRLTDEDGVDGAAVEENSKFRLQRLMDTRKALLQKEQAMAYARAVVAGFEIDTIDDLICFADTFGASRLRVACTDFKELYKQKHSDNQWMDELAAVQACSIPDMSYMGMSGIMVAGENNHSNGNSEGPFGSNGSLESPTTNSDGSRESKPASDQTSSTSAKALLQVPWMDHIPPYTYNFQNPTQQYQGYPFPGMHPVLPYFPGNMGWPQNVNGSPNGIIQQSNGHQNQKSSRRKEKPLDVNGTETSEEDEQNESSDSYSGTDSDESKKHGKKHSSKGQPYVKKHNKKSSKTVVIRNINYITSGRRNEEEDGVSDDSSALDEASIREGVDNAIASLEKHSHSKTHKNREHRGSHSQNGPIDNAEQDFKNDVELSISDGVKKKGKLGRLSESSHESRVNS
ncbi:COP1-interacting protein 7 [Forsythia ovata]|uniref:COP1-interacting protein 7 n=1 Tax=Forsythia ovata TaxID=205694 RepID=A0ABD1R7I0_9LAMI